MTRNFGGKDMIWITGPGTNSGVSRIDMVNGDLLQTITFDQIVEANPELDILAIRQNEHDRTWMKYPWHLDYFIFEKPPTCN